MLIYLAVLGSVLAHPDRIEPKAESCPTLPSFMAAGGEGDRIIGGQAAESPIPWQVSLQKASGKHYCGGTILDSTTILTAAHCVDNPRDYSKHFVMAGSISKKSKDKNRVSQVIVHPKWEDGKVVGHYSNGNPIRTFVNDLAIVKLLEPLTFDENVQPMCLPSEDFEPVSGQICYDSGWGKMQIGKFNKQD